eukprot:scaffold2375_cov107-Isochrysis_galbana.AAC.2
MCLRLPRAIGSGGNQPARQTQACADAGKLDRHAMGGMHKNAYAACGAADSGTTAQLRPPPSRPQSCPSP